MITVPERIMDSDPPRTSDKRSPKEVRKVVVIQVKSRLGSDATTFEDSGGYGEKEAHDIAGNMGQVLGSRIVDLKQGRVLLWFLKRTAGSNLGFEFPFLQGAAAAIVLLELSDRETIRVTKELLRDICKLFSIPVMLVVGGAIEEDLIASEAPMGLGEIASKVFSFNQNVMKTTVPAS